MLYKFRPLDDDEARSHVEDILRNDRLYLAAASSFDDPFECLVRYDFDAPPETKLDKAVTTLMEREHLTLSEARKKAPSLIDSVENGAIQQVPDWLLNKVGVSCLVPVRDDVLMWSHYASGHTGICIEFKSRAFEHHAFFGSASKVSYQDDVPVVNWYLDGRMAIVRKFVYTKSSVWSYEHEYRIADPEPPPNRFFGFDPLLVGVVYLGCRISDDDRELVTQWCKNRRNTVIYQARPSHTVYGLTFHKL